MGEQVVLIVNDDLTSLLTIAGLFKQEGFRVVQTGTAAEAQSQAAGSHLDLALLDVHLPDEDGLSLCRWFKARHPDLPVLMISGDHDVGTKVSCLEAGAVNYVTKPFHRAEVMARARTHLRLSMAHRSLVEMQREKMAQLAAAQQSILPQPTAFPEARFGVFYRPMNEVGGDLYEVLPAGVGIHDYMVADVSGHDVGAAMSTAALHALIKQNCSSLYSPAELLTMLNRVVAGVVPEGRYFTAVYARLNRYRGTLTVVSAGHPPVLLQRAGGATELLWLSGDVIGAFEEAQFEDVNLQVLPGDRLLLLSDGIVDQFTDVPGRLNWSEGADNLAKLWRERASLPLVEFVSCVGTLAQERAEVKDDMVVVGVEV